MVITCTSKPQKWHKPSKKQQRKHAPASLNDITIKKPKSERVLQDTKEKHYCRSLFDPRALHHQKPPSKTNDIYRKRLRYTGGVDKW